MARDPLANAAPALRPALALIGALVEKKRKPWESLKFIHTTEWHDAGDLSEELLQRCELDAERLRQDLEAMAEDLASLSEPSEDDELPLEFLLMGYVRSGDGTMLFDQLWAEIDALLPRVPSPKEPQTAFLDAGERLTERFPCLLRGAVPPNCIRTHTGDRGHAPAALFRRDFTSSRLNPLACGLWRRTGHLQERDRARAVDAFLRGIHACKAEAHPFEDFHFDGQLALKERFCRAVIATKGVSRNAFGGLFYLVTTLPSLFEADKRGPILAALERLEIKEALPSKLALLANLAAADLAAFERVAGVVLSIVDEEGSSIAAGYGSQAPEDVSRMKDFLLDAAWKTLAPETRREWTRAFDASFQQVMLPQPKPNTDCARLLAEMLIVLTPTLSPYRQKMLAEKVVWISDEPDKLRTLLAEARRWNDDDTDVTP